MSAILDTLLYTFNSDSSTLKYDDPIKFNYNYTFANEVISQSEDKGSFYILKPGKYAINWWVATQSGSSSNSISFAIKSIVNGAIQYQAAATPLKTGSIGGNSIISVSENAIPFKFELVNVTGYGDNTSVVILALETIVQAGMTVIGVEDQNGPVGPQGPMGPAGVKGERGERGATGPRGDIGPRGLTGERGLKGLTGDKGEKGEQGIQGIQGKTGEQGIQGEKGETGARGPAGADGTSSIKKISCVNYSIEKISAYQIPAGESIIFNTQNCIGAIENMQFTNSSIMINSNGDINLLEPGIYDFSWYLSVVGTEQVSELSISILKVVGGVSDNTIPLIKCVYSNIIIGSINGQGVVKIDSPTTVRLVNTSIASGSGSNGSLDLNSNNPMKGSIKITAYTL